MELSHSRQTIYFISLVSQQVFGAVNGDSKKSLVVVFKIWLNKYNLVLTSFWHCCRGLKKMNLSINILTKERITNLEIFLYFIINFRKKKSF